VFYEWEMDELTPAAGEDWDHELLVPAQGRLVYVGQGQCQYTFHEPTPGLLYPKKRRKKKKKKACTPQPPPPEPEPLPPAPIDSEDWEEICPPVPHVDWQSEDWEEICPPSPREDWDAEIAASQGKEDWDAEIAASQ
jgi:hypothetical protein